jgi:methyl-accepting chemotaxis protein
LIANITPDVEGMVKNVNGITSKVDRLAGVADDVANVIDSTGQKVGSTVDVLTDTIAETALAFQFNAKNVTSYIELIKEIVEIVRDSLKKY